MGRSIDSAIGACAKVRLRRSQCSFSCNTDRFVCYYCCYPFSYNAALLSIRNSCSSRLVLLQKQRFLKYSILGDDIVIGDRHVAELYEEAMEELQMTISKEKSLIAALKVRPYFIDSSVYIH